MESTLIVNGLKINYKETGTGTHTLVLLHGWGSNLQAFTGVQNHFQDGFRVISIDLPGFGKSQEPAEVWDVNDFTVCIEAFLKQKNISSPILAGHSHGGRVAITYASRNPVHKLILLDAAGIKPTRKLSYYIKVYWYKLMRKTLTLLLPAARANAILDKYRKKAGSTDYQNASPMMRQILVKVVNEDLKHLMPKINTPTLLVWGENDTATPVEHAKIMEKLIPNAGLVVFKGAGHFAFVEKLYEFLIVLDNFLATDKTK